MIFAELALPGAFLVEAEMIADDRGAFGRLFCAQEFAARGLDPAVAQCNLSRNRRRGTLRGLHWQAAPHGEAKLIRCLRGAAFLVLVDLRSGSATRHRWTAVELSGEGGAVYVPKDFAAGFLTLADDSELHYQMSAPYVPAAARGARWDDPAFAIAWPFPPAVISERDAAWPDYAP